jgi:hypothetical protein
MVKEKLHQVSISELILIEQYLQQSYGDLNLTIDRLDNSNEEKEKIEGDIKFIEEKIHKINAIICSKLSKLLD